MDNRKTTTPSSSTHAILSSLPPTVTSGYRSHALENAKGLLTLSTLFALLSVANALLDTTYLASNGTRYRLINTDYLGPLADKMLNATTNITRAIGDIPQDYITLFKITGWIELARGLNETMQNTTETWMIDFLQGVFNNATAVDPKLGIALGVGIGAGALLGAALGLAMAYSTRPYRQSAPPINIDAPAPLAPVTEGAVTVPDQAGSPTTMRP